MPKVDLTLEQLVHTLEDLTSGELETLEIMLNPELRRELEKRRAEAEKELAEGKILTSEELFK